MERQITPLKNNQTTLKPSFIQAVIRPFMCFYLSQTVLAAQSPVLTFSLYWEMLRTRPRTRLSCSGLFYRLCWGCYMLASLQSLRQTWQDRVHQLFPQVYVMLSSAPCTQEVKIVLIRK